MGFLAGKFKIQSKFGVGKVGVERLGLDLVSVEEVGFMSLR